MLLAYVELLYAEDCIYRSRQCDLIVKPTCW